MAGFLAPSISSQLISTGTRSAAPARAVQSVAAHTSREVFGFALASSLSDPTVGYPSWNFDLLSTVAFFGLHVDTAGHFIGDNGWTVWNSSALTNLVSIAHQHGVKVVLTVVLQDFGAGTPNMCAGLKSADATVTQTVQEVKAKGVDGVNIDYEGLDGSCGMADPYWSQHAMTAFAQKMRAGLGSSYYLSIDTYAGAASDGYGFFDVVGLAAVADSLFVMAYDLEYSNYSRAPANCSSFCLGPTSPLSGYYYNNTDVASKYVAAVGAGKVLLGVPYFGRKACVGAAVPNAYPTSSVVADSYLDASTEVSYYEVKAGTYAAHREANSSGMERWDTWFNTVLNCTRELYWDDAVSLGKKYDLVNADGLRGVGIWNLNYGGGAPELWAALQSHFSSCTGAAVTASPASPQRPGAQIVFAGASTGCPNPLYEFVMLPSGSSTWQVVQAYSANTTFTWNSTGAAPGTERFGIHVRDASTSASSDSVASASIPYTVTPPTCTSVTVSAAPPSSASAGTQVTFTATALGCPSAQYAFWARWQGSTTWQLLQGYSTSNVYKWNSTGAAPDTEYIGVWAKDAGSATGTFDANASIPYSVTPACASVTASAAPASVVHGAGTHVTITGVASGCANANPRYEFWMRPAWLSTWQLVQGYSTSATYDWNSAGAPAGTIYFGVWVKDAGSPNSVDAFVSTAVTMT